MRLLALRRLRGDPNVRLPPVSALLLTTLILLRALDAAGQERQTFEITSVRVNQSREAGAILRPHPDGAITITNHSLIELIEFVFDVRSDQIVGAPDWASTRRFDILAKGGPNAPAIDGRRESSSIVLKLRSLLEDRFGLKVWLELREHPVFELLMDTPNSLGPQLSTSAGCDASTSPAAGDVKASGQGGCGLLFGPTGLRGNGVPMREIAKVLGMLARLPVIDHTGLTGAFDVQMTFRPEEFEAVFAGGNSTPDLNMPSLFTAVEEQLGLRLRATRAPMQTVVIDAVQMPDPN